jgi:hypothetical protein
VQALPEEIADCLAHEDHPASVFLVLNAGIAAYDCAGGITLHGEW